MINGLTFTKAYIKGFGSIIEQEFNWGIKGLNIIKAPNGYGKTKFINALIWCLYGKTLSGSVETWEHIRGTAYDGTIVSQEFIHNGNIYKVTRCRDYLGVIDGVKGKSRLIFYTNGKPDNRGKVIVQKQIESTLGYSFELFKNSIIFGQKLKRIISETGPNKKKVLEEAFEMIFIVQSKKYADDELIKKRSDKLKQSSKVEVLENKLKSKQELLENINESITNFESEKKRDITTKNIEIGRQEVKIKDLKSEIKGYTQEFNEYNKLTKDKVKQDKELSKYPKDTNKSLTNLEADKKYKERLLKNLTEEQSLLTDSINNIPNICSRCNKPYTKSEKAKEKKQLQLELANSINKAKEINESLSNINGQILALNTQLSSAIKLEKSITSLDIKIRKLEANNKYLSGLKDKLTEYEETLVELMHQLKHIQGKVPQKNTKEVIRDIRDLEIAIKPERISLRRLRRDVEVYEWLVKDPLSNSGLKAFIFNEMLDSINDRLLYYAQYVNFQVVFTINLESHNKDLEIYVYQGDYPVPYEDLSGGQQQAVDIASAFAIHDIVSGNKVCSLLVMDELFESLDKSNIEILTELIQDKANDKCLYLITHRHEFSPTNSNIIEVDFNSGITSIKR